MKHIKKISFFMALALITLNCSDKIDDIVPEDDLSADVIFSTFSTIEATTVGIYDGMQDGAFIGVPEMINDFTADNVDFVGSFTTLQDIRDFNANATNGTIAGAWFDLFDVIRDANNILVNLPSVDPANLSFVNSANSTNFETLRAQFLGEARFARALSTFQGANTFAQPFQFSNGSSPGMPLVVDFFEGDITPFQLPRVTLNETHAFIEQDLIMAMNSLPESNGIRASSTAARALLARLYLYREQWTDAANMANAVINTSGFSLAPDFTFYNNPSTEHIFRVINQADDPAFDTNFDTFYNPTSNNGRGDLPFSQDLIDAFMAEPGDLRFDISILSVDAGNNDARFTSKYPNGATGESDPNVLRMGEVYLNRAEANFRGGTSIGDTPLNDVNAIRARAGLAPLASITLDDILLERRKELCFEGHRRLDLLRNNSNLKPNNPSAISEPGSNMVILPIPADELNINPNIQQNPGY